MNVRFVYKVLFYKSNTFWEDSVIFHTKVVLQKKVSYFNHNHL